VSFPAWRYGLGLQQYAQAFCDNAIDPAIAPLGVVCCQAGDRPCVSDAEKREAQPLSRDGTTLYFPTPTKI
jgi:hypothetical protein